MTDSFVASEEKGRLPFVMWAFFCQMVDALFQEIVLSGSGFRLRHVSCYVGHPAIAYYH